MEYKKPSVFVKNYKVLHEECKTVKARIVTKLPHLGGRGQSEERQLCFLDGEHHARLCEFENKL